MGAIDFAGVSFGHRTGALLLDRVSFKVDEGDHAALVGANGVGKTTVLRLIAGELTPTDGTINRSGNWQYMSQMIGVEDGLSVRDLYLRLSPPEFRAAAAGLALTEAAMTGDDGISNGGEPGVAYAEALSRWGDMGGYDLEVLWAECADRAVGIDWTELADRPTNTFSGGQQKRLALELLFRSDYGTLLLDEPDNFLDVPGKDWLALRMDASDKTILFISHDRELLARASRKVITIEPNGAWTLGHSFTGWADARAARQAKIEKDNREWAEERQRLVRHVKEMKRRAGMSEVFAKKAKAAESRLRHFDEAERPPDTVGERRLDMRLNGGRTGKRAVIVEQLELVDLTFPFDVEVWFGDRVAVVGRNGTGKSHFLRLLDGGPVEHEGRWRLGAGVVPGRFSQTHEHPELTGRTLLDIVIEDHVQSQINARGRALGLLNRYELQGAADQTWETLSGGQQARFQILQLELSGATLLLLDEPTDNLDVASAEALEAGLAGFEGTVIAVSHDRWFLRSFDRFLIFDDDAEVRHADTPDSAWV